LSFVEVLQRNHGAGIRVDAQHSVFSTSVGETAVLRRQGNFALRLLSQPACHSGLAANQLVLWNIAEAGRVDRDGKYCRPAKKKRPVLPPASC
jgi:hypothetical protein